MPATVQMSQFKKPTDNLNFGIIDQSVAQPTSVKGPLDPRTLTFAFTFATGL